MTEDVSDIAFIHQENPSVSSSWYIYFDASKHIIGLKDWFSSLDNNANPVQVQLGNDTSHDIEGKGDVHVQLGKNNYQINEILYVPKIKKNLLSISQMLDKNMKVEFDIVKGENICFIHDKSKGCQIIAKAKGVERMFLLEVVASNNQTLNVCVVDVTTLWQCRFEHMNPNCLITLQKKDMVHGLPSLTSTNVCSTCIVGKKHRIPFGDSTHCAKGPLDVIHTDLCDPI